VQGLLYAELSTWWVQKACDVVVARDIF
jgi:hypothetical protein